MKKIEKTSELFWILGTLFVALGVSICSKTNLGVSMIAAPAFVIQEALVKTFSWLSVGIAEYIFQGVLLVILIVAIRHFHWSYLLAFAVAVIYGYTLNLFIFLFKDLTFQSLWMRWVMLIVGDVATAFGVACFFKTYFPLQVYELFVAEFSSRFHFPIHRTKLFFDLSLLAVSVTLALTLFGDVGTFNWRNIGSTAFHSIGLGTIVTTLINSPIISFFSKLLDRVFLPTALFPKAERVLKRN